MKYIYLNLKRFDVPASRGGVNRGDIWSWGPGIISGTREITRFKDAEFAVFLPEAHLMAALGTARDTGSPMHIGCQSVYRDDVAPGVNFGAFTSNRPAQAMAALGVDYTIIGHCEERRDKIGVLAEAGVTDTGAINRVLNRQVRCAAAAGLKVLYCVGETSEEQPHRYDVLAEQLAVGLEGLDLAGEHAGKVALAYEPVWAIGPGKTPPDAAYITDIARFIKSRLPELPLVYGGGLKSDNAAMLAGIAEIDGGLIALTRFSGEIGFYPEEYMEIVRLYLGA
ncbi:MAG: triose-phosphate isomerase family protein [Anaerolineae bacterium]